jgi:hypothetical protein
MKYWMLLCCLVLAGCGSSGPSNVAENADKAALEAYEAALAEADQMAAEDTELED